MPRKLTHVEKHHILPLKLGGSNNTANIARLTPREHFIAHWLLTKFTSGDTKRSMCYALSYFRTNNKNHNRKLTSKQYEVARNAFSQARLGVQPSKKCKAAVSKAKSGVPLSKSQREKMSVSLRRKHNVFFLIGSMYGSNTDFYRFCAEQGLGRSAIQAGLSSKRIHVITSGKHKGKCFSWEDVGSAEMELAAINQCMQATERRKVAVSKVHANKLNLMG